MASSAKGGRQGKRFRARTGGASAKPAKPAPVDEEAELEELERRSAEEAPARGTQASAPFPLFEEMPLSSRTKRGLADGGFTAPTEIQASCIPHALAGRDVLGAARTGSGARAPRSTPLLAHHTARHLGARTANPSDTPVRLD
jgi:superfamily II DNA/RNA helicase